MSEWVIPCNAKYYDVDGAFSEFTKINLKQSTNVEVGDIVYIYVGNPYSSIRYKCVVNKIDLEKPEYDDSKYEINDDPYTNYGRYMELELKEKFKNDMLKLEDLLVNGLKSVQGPSIVTEELSSYIKKSSYKKLIQYKKYNREEIHNIFEPNTQFTPNAGTWGLQGIVKDNSCEGNYVFIVTLGMRQAEFEFDEGITKNGILTWQTQPRMNFLSNAVKDFILHDEKINSIYLFLRLDTESRYTYLGELAYITHDNERINPVHFIWKIIDFNSGKAELALRGIEFIPEIIIDKNFILHRNGIKTNEFENILKSAGSSKINKSPIEEKITKFIPTIKKYENEDQKLELLRKKFIDDYKIKTIQQLTKEEYVVGLNRTDTFCYRLENELIKLGNIHGPTSVKFGLYYGKKGDDSEKKYRTSKLKFGDDPDIALEEIKEQIIFLILDGKNENIEGIKNCTLAPLFKGKILSVYYPDKYICIFADEHLNYFLDKLNIKYSIDAQEIDKQLLLMKWKRDNATTKDWTTYIFMMFLYSTFGRPDEMKKEAQDQSDDFKLIKDVNNSNIDKSSDGFKFTGKPQEKKEPVLINGRQSYPRDKKKALNALLHADYKCEIDNDHPTFIRRNSDLNYTEPHHLVPMAFSKMFDVSLDVEENIVSLCSNCHNQLHYGKEIESLLYKLFEDRKDDLNKVGINISYKKLIDMY